MSTTCNSTIARDCDESNCWRMGFLASALGNSESLDDMAQSLAYSVTSAFNDKTTSWDPKELRTLMFHLQKFIRQSDSKITADTDNLIKTQMAFLQDSVRDVLVQPRPMTGDEAVKALMDYLEQRSIQSDKKKRDSAGEGSSKT